MNFCDAVKIIRSKVFLSQEAFAKELGVAFTTVNRWETGKSMPSYKAMKQIDAFCKKNKLDFNIVMQSMEVHNEQQ